MDDSVQSYIEKQSTEFLLHFTGQCVRGNFHNDYDYLIPYLLRVLIGRNDFKELAIKEILSFNQQNLTSE